MKSPHKLLLRLFLTTILLTLGPWVRGAALTQQHRLNDHGQERIFTIATDELQIVGKRYPEKILQAADAEAIRRHAEILSRAVGKEVRLVLYPQGSVRTEFSR